jgi:hypothetical protein
LSGSSELELRSDYYHVKLESVRMHFGDSEREREWHRRWRSTSQSQLRRLRALLDAELPRAGDGWTLAEHGRRSAGARRHTFHPSARVKGLLTMSVTFARAPTKAMRAELERTVDALLAKLR